jgi:hypothetical protein
MRVFESQRFLAFDHKTAGACYLREDVVECQGMDIRKEEAS